MLHMAQNVIAEGTTSALTAKPALGSALRHRPQRPNPGQGLIAASHSVLFNTAQHALQLVIQVFGQKKQGKQADHLSLDFDFRPTVIYLHTSAFIHSFLAASEAQCSEIQHGQCEPRCRLKKRPLK